MSARCTLSSRERLLRTLKGKQVDRVPVSLYEFDGFYDSWIGKYPEYRDILEYAKGKTDKMYFWSPDWGEITQFYLTPIDREILTSKEWQSGNRRYVQTIIQTPRGKLQSTRIMEEGIHTVWQKEHFCKSIEDVEKFLSIPYDPVFPDVSGFRQADKHLGDEGILLVDLPDPLCMVAELFSFSDFLSLVLTEEKMIIKLLDIFYERIHKYLEHLLKNGVITLYRIVGPEYATPPYLAPSYFDKFVCKYDKNLISLIHSYGGLARIHCHGRIRQVLDMIISMQPDALDPIEPPPDGDIELKEVKKRAGDKITLMGNIEERCFETCSKKEIDALVRKAIEEGAPGGRFVLLPTAMPLTTPLDPKIKENIIQYINSGLKYGGY